MRILLISAGSLLATQAAAQGIDNGDFENDWAGWTDASSNGCNFGCEDGTADIIGEDEADGLQFPSPTKALMLTTGDDDGMGPGNSGSFGRVRSEPFLVTWESLGWQQIADARDQILTVEIFTPEGGQVANVNVDPSEDSWQVGALDISPACGLEIGVEITATLDQGGWDANYVSIWDDMAMGGTVCEQYVDGDGDGFCQEGVDLNGNGDCADEGEPDPDINDCDDTDGNIYPGAEDIGGNGIDENCDGVDEDAGSTGGTNMPTGDDDDDDDGKAKSEGLIAAGGAGCACNTGGSSPIGLFVFAALVLIRRRR